MTYMELFNGKPVFSSFLALVNSQQIDLVPLGVLSDVMFCVKHFFTPFLSPPKNQALHGEWRIKYLVICSDMKLSSRDHQLLLGAQAFDDLTMALETLGDVKGMMWLKEQTDLPKSAEMYLKSDFTVTGRYLEFEIVPAQFWNNSLLKVQIFYETKNCS